VVGDQAVKGLIACAVVPERLLVEEDCVILILLRLIRAGKEKETEASVVTELFLLVRGEPTSIWGLMLHAGPHS